MRAKRFLIYGFYDYFSISIKLRFENLDKIVHN